MPIHALVPDPDRLEVLALAADRGMILLTVRTCGETARCPVCSRPTSRVHSRYRRTLADVPWQGLPARVVLWSRRFFCDAADCPRRIFTERLPGVAAPHARRTDRLRDWLLHVVFALGGAPGARLLHQLGVPVCGATLLAQLRVRDRPAQPTPRVLSVDDFAFRRGQTYGSILVDLERHRVVDLLPDRQAATFAAWLGGRPPPRGIRRRRGGGGAPGGPQGGAPARPRGDPGPPPQRRRGAGGSPPGRRAGGGGGRVPRRPGAPRRGAPAPPPPAPPGGAPPPAGGWPALWRELRREQRDRRASRARTQQERAARFAAIHAG